MAKVTGVVRKVWCFINECLQQFAECSAEVRDAFHLLLKGSGTVGYKETKFSLALRHIWWKSTSCIGQTSVI